MNTQINYATLAGAYKGTMQGLVHALVQTNIVDINKYDELKAFIAKEIERIDYTYSKASTGVKRFRHNKKHTYCNTHSLLDFKSKKQKIKLQNDLYHKHTTNTA